MIVRRLRHLIGTNRDVGHGTFRSRRFLLARDGQGYSFHETVIEAGAELTMWYKHHVESVYCVGGEGELELVATGEVHKVEDGMLYCLDGNEPHILRATTDLRLICVFTPPVVGPELHDADGAFPLLTHPVDVEIDEPVTIDAVGLLPEPAVRVIRNPASARPAKRARKAQRKPARARRRSRPA